MTQLLSFPFRVPAYGAAATVEQGTEAYYDEQLAVIIGTTIGERLLHPSLGIPDVAFRGFQYSALEAQVAAELPEITNIVVDVEMTSDTTQVVRVSYDVEESE